MSALLAAGSDPERASWTWKSNVFGKASGQTPLHWAAESGCAEVVSLITDACAHVGAELDEKGRTPAEMAETGHYLAATSTASKGVRAEIADVLRRREEAKWVPVEITLDEDPKFVGGGYLTSTSTEKDFELTFFLNKLL